MEKKNTKNEKRRQMIENAKRKKIEAEKRI